VVFPLFSLLQSIFFHHCIKKTAKWLSINPRLRQLASLTRRTFSPAEVAQIYAELG
jgi:hypothetical protein